MSQEALQRGLIEPKNCTRSHCSASAGACLRCLASRAVARVRALWPSALAGLGKLYKTRRHRAELPVSVGTLSCGTGSRDRPVRRGGLRDCGGGPTKSPCCQVRQAPPKQQQPGPKSGSLIHVVLMLTAESRNRKCRCGPHVWSRGPVVFCPWPAPTWKHCQPAAASTRPDDDDDHNAAASTTTTRRRRRVTSQSQVSDAGGRVAEHDDG